MEECYAMEVVRLNRGTSVGVTSGQRNEDNVALTESFEDTEIFIGRYKNRQNKKCTCEGDRTAGSVQ